MKLYLYGYTNRIRSSRALEREAGRNLELIWLMKQLVPGYRTIANFRRDNWKALKATNREFVLLMRKLDLLGGEVVAIDGAFFDGNASKASIKTRRRLAKRLAEIEREIEAYGAALDANDSAEAERPPAGPEGNGGDGGGGVAQKVADLMAKRTTLQADLAQLEESGQTQLSRTDADARLLSKNGQVVAGDNVQIAVDDKHKLIAASEVVNDGNDTGQLYDMAKAAKDELGVETLTALADTGYYNGNTLKACEEDGIVAYVPQARRTARLEAQDRISHEAFLRGRGECLSLPRRQAPEPDGRPQDQRQPDRDQVCQPQVRLRRLCAARTLPPAKTPTRTVYRWEHEAVLDRHRARMKDADAQMRRRAELAEHPFGTLKCRAGCRHFLVRGFDKVRGEWSLMALCYNFSRVLSILGFDNFMAYLANRNPYWAL